MMKVFSERRSRAFEPVGESPAPRPHDLSGDDRLAKGFELLFGAHLERHRSELERVEAELGARLDALHGGSAEHERVLVALSDKASASLEREQDAERRRKAMEGELRQALGELREAVRSSLSELHARADRLEQGLVEHLHAQHTSEHPGEQKRQHEALLALEARLATLEAGRLDRADLAAYLARAAREIDGGA